MRFPSLNLVLFSFICSCGVTASDLDRENAAHLGSKNAPVELIVFSDFQCGYCKRAAAEIRRITTRHPTKVRVVFKHYPLSYHPQALNAAKASEAAGKQNRFWDMHDLLFAYAGELSDDIYPTLAEKLDLDLNRFIRDMKSIDVAAKIEKDQEEARALGLDGTPYFIINKVPFNGSYGDLERAILKARRGTL